MKILLKIIIFMVMVLISGLLLTEFPRHAEGALILLFLGLFIILSIVIRIRFWKNKLKRKKTSLKYTVLILIFLVGSYMLADVINNNHSKNNIPNREKVVKSLYKYKNDIGKFPGTLNQLVPVYIIKIPPVKQGITSKSFIYRGSNESFTLSYPDSKSKYGYEYNSDSQKWDLKD
ncbi:MAG: hypothetical protein GY754_16320 [bacterium]|nr:hypothetical protein [bacterium]